MPSEYENEIMSLLHKMQGKDKLNRKERKIISKWQKKEIPLDLIIQAQICNQQKGYTIEQMNETLEDWQRRGIGTVRQAKRNWIEKEAEQAADPSHRSHFVLSMTKRLEDASTEEEKAVELKEIMHTQPFCMEICSEETLAQILQSASELLKDDDTVKANFEKYKEEWA